MSKRKTNFWWKSDLGINTQKELTDRIRYIVNTTTIDKPIDKLNTEFLIKVLSHHHEFQKKSGVGIKHLEIKINHSCSGITKGIWIIRHDNTQEDITWVKALKPEDKSTIKEDVSNTARYEIYTQIKNFHDNGDCSICEICKNNMIRYEELHVDHIKLFEELFLDFLTIKNIKYSNIELEDFGVESKFKDRILAEEWSKFHKEYSSLRLVHKLCNLQRKRKNE